MAESNEPRAPVVGDRGSEERDDNTPFLPPKATTAQRTLDRRDKAKRHHFRALIMTELNRHRMERRWAMDGFCEIAGLPERYFSKALHAHEPSGREPSWRTLQIMVDCLFPDGVTVVFTPIPGPRRKAMNAEYQRRFPHRAPYADGGSVGGPK